MPNRYPPPTLADWKRLAEFAFGRDMVSGFGYGFGVGMICGMTLILGVVLVTAG